MKLAVVFVLGFLVSSSVFVTGANAEEQRLTQVFNLSFEDPILLDNGQTKTVQMTGAPACVYRPRYPVLPMYTVTIQLPFGSTIKQVTIQCGTIKTQVLQEHLTVAPQPLIQGLDTHSLDPTFSGEENDLPGIYPSEWMTYSTGAGLNQDDQHVTFFTVQVYPGRYNQQTDTLQYLDSCNITMTYDPPAVSPFQSQAKNDLLIICPTQFILPLLRLVQHKNMVGIRTQLISLAEIYRSYPGFDRPEQIKYCIKDFVETWGTTYVLLVGGLKSHVAGRPRDDLNSGTHDWYIPVRYANLWDDAVIYDPGFISDLYYADIYDSQGSFCSWDSFGDGVYGGWSPNDKFDSPDYPQDQIDFYPDVYLGRLPCRNSIEVRSVVRKIISYEKTSADPSWFKKIVVVGGDPYDDQGTNFLEGELIGEKAISYMPGFEPRRLFASNQGMNPDFTPLSQNIIREINQGCGFLLFDGHGGPSWWNTYWPGAFDSLIENGGLRNVQFSQLKNGVMLPICIVGGCHNNLFNVSLLSTLTDPRNTHYMWTNGIPIFECWGWSLTVKPDGGAIATIGNTGLGYEAGGEVGDLNGDGVNEPDCVESLCGYLETQFFRGYQVNHLDILGKNWGHTITEYLRIYPGMESWSDAKTLEQWVLFGDPTLKIGGYSS